MTRTGDLRERVAILQDTKTETSAGGRTAAPSTLATVWANVRALNGGERLQAQAIASNIAYEVEVQYRTDITPQMRLSWTPYGAGAKTLQVLGVRLKPGRRPERLLLDCAEGA